MKQEYYGENKHTYLRYNNDQFSKYIYSLIRQENFDELSNCIEFGSGMGRFSFPLVANFTKVTLVEPTPAYVAILRDSFFQDDVQIFQGTVQEFIDSEVIEPNPLVFCFHLLHHLSPEERGYLYDFIRNKQGKAVFVEQNPFNPLILLQILIHPDMSLAEEQQYLLLTPSRYRRELSQHGLRLVSYRRICPFPPFFMNFILNKVGHKILTQLEFIARYFPFCASYQVLICE